MQTRNVPFASDYLHIAVWVVQRGNLDELNLHHSKWSVPGSTRNRQLKHSLRLLQQIRKQIMVAQVMGRLAIFTSFVGVEIDQVRDILWLRDGDVEHLNIIVTVWPTKLLLGLKREVFSVQCCNFAESVGGLVAGFTSVIGHRFINL